MKIILIKINSFKFRNGSISKIKIKKRLRWKELSKIAKKVLNRIIFIVCMALLLKITVFFENSNHMLSLILLVKKPYKKKNLEYNKNIKRFMFSRVKNVYSQNKHTILNKYVFTKSTPKIITRDVSYHVDDATAMNSSHESAKKNPLLKKLWTKKYTDNSFQHPSLGRVTCNKSSCSDKICDRPCGLVTERVYVGHVTHSNKYGVFISYYDFNNKEEIQYFIPYINPVINYDVEGKNINQQKTENLNKTNKEARNMIHILSSKKAINPEDIT